MKYMLITVCELRVHNGYFDEGFERRIKMDSEKKSGRYSFSDDIDVKALVEFAALKEYRLMDICGHEVLFSEDGFVAVNGQIGNCRVYWLRGGYDNDPGQIASVEDKPVAVNYCGMILTDEKLDLDPDGYLGLEPEDWGFDEIELTVSGYLRRKIDRETGHL